MPGLDKTGPQGQGSRTGRSLGYCSPGSKRPSFGRGFRAFGRGLGLGLGRGSGFGRGWGWRYPYGDYPSKPTVKEEKEALTEELKGLKEEMKEMETRLDELKSEKTK